MSNINIPRLITLINFCFFPFFLEGQIREIGSWRHSQKILSWPTINPDYDPVQEEKNLNLMNAVFQNKFDEVVTAIEKGAHVNAWDYQGFTTIMYALYNADDEIINHLLLKGANLNSIDFTGTSVLMHAIMAEQDQFILENLDVFGAINHKNNNGYTSLIFASHYENLELVKALVNLGANINSATDAGTTPLIHAAAFGNFFVTDYLVNMGAKIGHRSRDGSTALHMAAYYGHNEVAGLLLSWGARLETLDSKGNTPLMAAIFGWQYETTLYLVENGASLTTQNNAGATPLSLASWLEDFDIVELLLDYRFEEEPAENKYFTTLAYSYFNRNRVLQQRLRELDKIQPRGLYFSEFVLYQGIDFNYEDMMYNVSLGLFESRFRMQVRMDFMTRLGSRKVLVPRNDEYSFRFAESRNAWMLGLQHEILLLRHRRAMLGIMPGVAVSWSQAQYRGTGMHPPEGFSVRPVADVFFHFWNFTLYTGYQYWDTGQKDIAPHRFRTGFAYRFPLFRKRDLNYRPIL